MAEAAEKTVSYDPSVFDVESKEQAEPVILGDELGVTSAARWKLETPYLVGLIEEHCAPVARKRVLDYGCGIGRLARPLVKKHNCLVVGLDISPGMRALAADEVYDDRFCSMAPRMLEMLPHAKFDIVLAVWALQHVLNLEGALRQIGEAMHQDSRLFVVNNSRDRALPTAQGFVSDGADVRRELGKMFGEVASGAIEEPTCRAYKHLSFWAVYGRRA